MHREAGAEKGKWRKKTLEAEAGEGAMETEME